MIVDCAVAGCPRPSHTRGWCRLHYQRWQRTGTTAVHEGVGGRRTGPDRLDICLVAGCEEAAKARGWCGRHYHKWVRYGDPLGVRVTGIARYEAKIALPNENGCRLWTAAVTRNGYGKFTCYEAGRQKTVPAHRWGYEHLVGPIPEGLEVCHSCDVPGCQTLEHWWLGTSADNAADKVAKGRQLRGEGQAYHKLTEVAVRDLLRLATDGATYAELGRQFGVNESTAGRIVKGTASRGLDVITPSPEGDGFSGNGTRHALHRWRLKARSKPSCEDHSRRIHVSVERQTALRALVNAAGEILADQCPTARAEL
jgi:hypothetical protein